MTLGSRPSGNIIMDAPLSCSARLSRMHGIAEHLTRAACYPTVSPTPIFSHYCTTAAASQRLQAIPMYVNASLPQAQIQRSQPSQIGRPRVPPVGCPRQRRKRLRAKQRPSRNAARLGDRQADHHRQNRPERAETRPHRIPIGPAHRPLMSTQMQSFLTDCTITPD